MSRSSLDLAGVQEPVPPPQPSPQPPDSPRSLAPAQFAPYASYPVAAAV
eukprot:CAMPEP_0184301110 /NCGR_PEP_ID=MMETSP1049-20130417/11382_1 /TAXON_ID=77928 /ORGANISM="Proteomonas sulcata, Strain CCMP704" /LENGTH=48 /DNA_ID= /DNA_START= /DNA_END= /DNA_ORIENTATION=